MAPELATERPKEVKFRRPKAPVFEDPRDEAAYRKDRLMVTGRILAREGYEHCGTWLSVRDGLKRDSLWTVPFGVPLSTLQIADLIQIDFVGNVLSPGARGSAYDKEAIAIHTALYTAPERSDIDAIIHSHAPHSRAFASNPNRKLEMISQDAATFYDRWATIPLKSTLNAAQEPHRLQDAIGPAVVVTLAHRGSLAVNRNIESCLGYFLRLDGLCYIQLLAEAASRGRGIPMVYVTSEAAAVTVKGVSGPDHAWTLSRPNFIREERYIAQEQRA